MIIAVDSIAWIWAITFSTDEVSKLLVDVS